MDKGFKSQASCPGTGESLCQTSPILRTRATNTPLNKMDAKLFILFIGEELTIEWGSEKKRNYGTAYSGRRLIRLNRICVGTFLHEVAHIVAFKIGAHGHDQRFAFVLDSLYKKWTEYIKIKES